MRERQLRCQCAEWDGFYVRFSVVSNLLPTWTPLPYLVAWSAFLCFFCLFFFYSQTYHMTLMLIHQLCIAGILKYTPHVTQWTCPKQFGDIWQKFPFIRKKMVISNVMICIIACHMSSEPSVSKACSRWWVPLVITLKFKRGHEVSLIKVWHHYTHKGLISTVIPSLMTCWAALDF